MVKRLVGRIAWPAFVVTSAALSVAVIVAALTGNL